MKIFKKYYSKLGTYQGIHILELSITKYFKLHWFTDCGNWFIYITIYKTIFRFSDCGFMIIK